jgi:hypothetical protein
MGLEDSFNVEILAALSSKAISYKGKLQASADGSGTMAFVTKDNWKNLNAMV